MKENQDVTIEIGLSKEEVDIAKIQKILSQIRCYWTEEYYKGRVVVNIQNNQEFFSTNGESRWQSWYNALVWAQKYMPVGSLITLPYKT